MIVKNNDFGKTLIKITLLIDYHIKSQWCVAELFLRKIALLNRPIQAP